MHLSIILWGLTAVLGKGIGLNEGLLVWYRMLIVSVSLFVYLRILNISIHVSVNQFKRLFLVGTLLMIHWIFFYGAIKYSNVSVTLSLFASTTLFTAILEPTMTGKKFDTMEILYSILALLGIGIIFYSDSNNYTAGIILALLAAFVGAFFNILNKSIVHELNTGVVSFYEISMGFLSLTILMPLYLHMSPSQKLFPDTSDWIQLFVLAILCTHVTLILSLNALRHLSAFTLNLAINLEPVYGIALAFIFFGEDQQLNRWFFAGASIIMMSVVLHSLHSKRQRNT